MSHVATLLSVVTTHQRLFVVLVLLTLLVAGGAGQAAAAPYDTGIEAFCNSGAPDQVKANYC